MKKFVLSVSILALLVCGFALWWQFHKNPETADTVPPITSNEQGFETGTGKAEFARIERKQHRTSASLLSEQLTALLDELNNETNQVLFEVCSARQQVFIDTLSTNSFESAFSELARIQKNHSSQAGQELQLRLLQRWSETDIHAAASAFSLLEGQTKLEAAQNLASLWAKKDLSQSTAWAKNLPNEAEREKAFLGIAQEAALTDPKQALVLASQIRTIGDRPELISQAATTWATKDPDGALAWARKVEDPELREQVIASTAVSLADKDPFSAANLILDSLTDGKEQERAVLGVVQRLTFQNADSARTWVDQFPEGALKTSATAEINRILERQSRVQTRAAAGAK